MKDIGKITFDKIEIGDVLYCNAKFAEEYFFIYDKTKDTIYYTCYEVKNNSVIYSRGSKDRDVYQSSLLADAQTYAPKGELVKRMMDANSIKDLDEKK